MDPPPQSLPPSSLVSQNYGGQVGATGNEGKQKPSTADEHRFTQIRDTEDAP
jgi:hypothetical protein